jgi:hypothetical protein
MADVMRTRRCIVVALLMALALLGVAGRAQAQSVGVIRTIAGGGASDPGDGGPALDAVLANPGGLARDAAGNLYIADTAHHRIRRIETATGVITTVAGTGAAGYGGDGGAATSALLNAPQGIALDPSGNLYIADTNNHCVRKVTESTGIIRRISGVCTKKGYNTLPYPGEWPSLRLRFPTGVAFDGRGAVYIADRDNHRIRIQDSEGVDYGPETVAGTSPMPADDSIPPYPDPCPITEICCSPHTNPYVGGYSGDGGPASQSQLRCPSGVTVSPAGDVLIADSSNHAIRRISATTGIITTVAGGHWYAPYTGVGQVLICSMSGDGGPATTAYLCEPTSVAADVAGNLYVVDDGNSRIRMVAARTGVITTVAGTGVTATFGDIPVGQSGFSGDGGPATSALLHTAPPNWYEEHRAAGVVLDPAGNLYFSDSGNNRIRSIVFSDVSLTGDVDGDGKSDLIAWRRASGVWYFLTSTSGYDYAAGAARQWGNWTLGDAPLVGDVDGDGRSDFLIWRASTGTWYWLTSSSGYTAAAGGCRQWGSEQEGDVPLLGDLDGDGRSDLVVWRASTGTWYWLTSSSGYDYGVQHAVQWGSGALGDVPLLADVDGDGRSDLVVWRASTGTWYWLGSATGYSYGEQRQVQWGSQAERDTPLLADLDGDGRADLIVWRASTGTWYWLPSMSGFDPAAGRGLPWGADALGDVPRLADFDGDRVADLTVWRASSGTWFWLSSASGYAAGVSRQWGSSSVSSAFVLR